MRLDARRRIVEAANVKRRQLGDGTLMPYRMRHINQAVCCVRHFDLVAARTLEAAGWRARP